MAVQQIVTVYINLKGDGSSTTFVFPMSNLYVQSFGGSIPYGSAGVVPSAIAVNNPPVPVTSATIDTFGNITITLTSALGSGIVANFELDLFFNSGAATATTVVQTDEVAVFGHANAIMDVVIGGATAAANALQVAGVFNSVSPTLSSGQGAALQLDSTGNLRTRVIGGSNNPVDFAGQNASSNPNAFAVGGQFNASPTTISSGFYSPLQLDSSGNLKININAGTLAVAG